MLTLTCLRNRRTSGNLFKRHAPQETISPVRPATIATTDNKIKSLNIFFSTLFSPPFQLNIILPPNDLPLDQIQIYPSHFEAYVKPYYLGPISAWDVCGFWKPSRRDPNNHQKPRNPKHQSRQLQTDRREGNQETEEVSADSQRAPPEPHPNSRER